MKTITNIIYPAFVLFAFAWFALSAAEARLDLPNNGAQTVHFTAVYEGQIGGSFTCAGERIRKRAPKPFTKDSEECTITDLSTFPPGTYVGNPFFSVNGVPYVWNSDYDGREANFVTLNVTDNGDGTGDVEIVAYY